MTAARWIVAMVVASLTCGVALTACRDAAPSAGATEEGGIAPVVLGDGAWGASDCASCTFDACRGERTTCQAEPGCARNLDCIEACTLTADGDPDAACVSACPVTSASASEDARLALEHCRTIGAATACASCAAARARRHTNPLLTTYCADGAYDASPDDTPSQTACATCSSKKCCAPHEACVADPGCFAYQRCIGACGNTKSPCATACEMQYDTSLGHFWGLYACNGVLCNAECGFAGVVNQCLACIYESCGDEQTACQADHDCKLLSNCIDACGAVADCQAGCRAKFSPGASGLLADLLVCGGQRCPSCR